MENKCVLICDDDEDILEVTKTILSMRGYHVETINNCDNLLEVVKKVQPDIILMDLRIPEIGGEEATRILKSTDYSKDIPVFIFSANNDIERAAANAGADGFLRKHFEIKALEDIIEHHVA